MISDKLELRKLIFQILFQPKFDLLDKRGRLLTIISQKELYDKVGLTKSGLTCKSEKEDLLWTLGIDLTDVSGSIEHKNVHIKSQEKIFKLVNDIFNVLDVSEILRIGLRYFFIQQVKSYDALKDVLIKKHDQELVSLLGEKFSDLAIILVSQETDHFVRYRVGPIRKKEYAHIFDKPDSIDYDWGLCFDCDYFVEKAKYKEIRLDHYVESSYLEISEKVNNVADQIINELRAGK